MLENHPLIQLYLELIVGISVGFLLGRILPKHFTTALGKGLYWVGVPIIILKSVRGASLTGTVLVAPITAWIAILVGALFAWTWIELGRGDEQLKAFAVSIEDVDDQTETDELIDQLTALQLEEEEEHSADPNGALDFNQITGATWVENTAWSRPTQGSFLLAMMLGNTAYLGLPVVIALVGDEYVIWAVLFNILGTTLGVHGLGFAIASRFGANQGPPKNLFWVLLKNPALWSCVVGILIRELPLPTTVDESFAHASRLIVMLSLVMIGMQLSQLSLKGKIQQASTCLVIKMLLVPLVVGTSLLFFGIPASARLTLVLQMAMPPSFATVLYAQAYELDRDLSVTTAAFGTIALLFTLPLWVVLFDA